MTRPLTGRHVLAIALGAFGVVVAANATLAVLATGGFPGLVVANSYVASQSFDRDRAALAATGWRVSIDHADGVLLVAVEDRDGRPVEGLEASATVGRPGAAATDRTVALAPRGERLAAPLALDPGRWRVRLRIAAPGVAPLGVTGALRTGAAS